MVCTYNGSLRLPNTLAHIASQRWGDVDWEVLVVDNASSDNVAEVALRTWKNIPQVDFRVVREPLLGLSNARRRGLDEAKYDVVSFIDDDNWICPGWVRTVSEIMTENPSVGICGGYGEPVCEIDPPTWFDDVKHDYAVGKLPYKSGDVTQVTDALLGAGLCIRREAWRDLANRGFAFRLSDRMGSNTSTGGDLELCFALKLAQWGLWYDERLYFRHFIQAYKLEWGYYRNLKRGWGRATVALDAYEDLLRQGTIPRVKTTWTYRFLATIKRLSKSSAFTLVSPAMGVRRLQAISDFDYCIGRLSELARHRKQYSAPLRWLSEASRQDTRPRA